MGVVIDPQRSLSLLVVRLLAGMRAGDWTVRDEGPWCRIFPAGHVSRRQGWKLHLSGTPLTVARLLERAVPVLVQHRCAAKVPAGLGWATWLNSPQCPRGAAGKILTAYPDDDEHFLRVADALHKATTGLVGPGILSDRRYMPDGIVYYRFGGFTRDKALNDDGRYQPVIIDPAGVTVEDRREAWFSPPSWAVPVLPDPPPDPNPAGPVVLNRRFVVHWAIRHSSRGGVFLGIDQVTGAAVVVKQARSYMDVDPSGRDCRDRLRAEADLLRQLAPRGLTPGLVEVVPEGDDLYLVREAIEGQTLRQWVLGRMRGWEAPDDVGLTIARAVVRLIAAVHRQGLVLVDVSPNNIMVDATGRLWLTDLDHCVRHGDVLYPVGTPAYTAPELLAANGTAIASPATDRFGLGGLLFMIAVGASPAVVADDPPDRPVSERLRAWLDAAGPETPLAARFAEAIVGLTDDRPDARWHSNRVLRFLGRVDPGPTRKSPQLSLAGLRQTVDRLIDDGVADLVAHMTPEGERLWPASRSGASADPYAVQHGAAGVLAALVRAARWAGEPASLLTAVERGCQWIAKHLPAEPPLPGLYFGRSGTAWAWHEAAELIGDHQLAADALELALRVPVTWENPDVAHGAGGAGMMLLHLWHATGDPRLPGRIRACADGLVAAATGVQDGTIAWPIPSTLRSVLAGRTFHGYAHGTAGVATVLLAAFQETGAPGYLRLVERAAATLEAAAWCDDTAAFWPVGPQGKLSSDASWCKGSAGIGTFLLRVWQVTGRPRSLELARAAAVAVHRSRLRSTTATCHGLAGGGQFLLDLAEALHDEAVRGWAWDLAHVLAARSVRRGGRLLLPDETGQEVTPDYGVGNAGTVDFLLRLRRGGSRPWMVDTPTSAPTVASAA